MYIGVDIGGTKCAVTRASVGERGDILVLKKEIIPTGDAVMTIEKIIGAVERMMPAEAIGISCGGPLDEEQGIIKSPPNLPGWDNIEIVKLLRERFGIPTAIVNDANACALAEWRYGAGRGTKNMIFLTFGTGLGAGLILDGRLYTGTNGNAGEVGHVRLAEDGPLGFGKSGSFEGFCSGGGISRLAQKRKDEAFCSGRELFTEGTDAATVARLAEAGDPDALAVYAKSAEMLGLGLSMLVDVLNPERIVIGSVFKRSESLFREKMTEVMKREALGESLSVCKVVPSELGDSLGDFAAIAVAERALEEEKTVCKRGEKMGMSYIDALGERYPELSDLEKDISDAVDAVVETYEGGGKILLVGNGGSAADCEHISGELLKGFLMRRELVGRDLRALEEKLGERAGKLQKGIPAIPLTSLTSALSAFANDVDPELVYAQLVLALGKKGDLLIAISTSGNSKNVTAAAASAAALGVRTVSLTGAGGGELAGLADISIKAPSSETYKIQEYHLPIYHAICAEAERKLFGNCEIQI